MRALDFIQVLLADRNATMFRNLGSGFRHKQQAFNPIELILWLTILGGVFAGLGWAAKAWARRQKKVRAVNSPRRLFRALCRAHAIDRRGSRLLMRLAAFRGLQPPALIFVSPESFDNGDLDVPLRRRSAELTSLRLLLFSSNELKRVGASIGDAGASEQVALEERQSRSCQAALVD